MIEKKNGVVVWTRHDGILPETTRPRGGSARKNRDLLGIREPQVDIEKKSGARFASEKNAKTSGDQRPRSTRPRRLRIGKGPKSRPSVDAVGLSPKTNKASPGIVKGPASDGAE